MARYVLTDQYGRYLNTLIWDGVAPLTLTPGHSLVEEGQFTPLPGEGSPYHVWNDTTHAYELDTGLLQAARDQRWEACKAYRDNVRNMGGFLVAGQYWFHSDTPSKIDQLGLLNATMLNSLPPTDWSLMDGSSVPLTSQLVGAIFQTAMIIRGTNFAVAKVHKAAIYASNDPLNYDFTTGWPLVFGE